eukprot:CAMPEP_0170188322 /NCGR_PEP_ID=MMETSP0040_2-20121228/44066_1 /TAXON_ID=641309 /ORGANISM="Lotharella oceanica, Strain CCMP622" /LENGTH=418 /DNA_ID=CAMNT_0010435597 /DNA_START=62 /DNA_END=1318 /DNA_ORIENTATION=+
MKKTTVAMVTAALSGSSILAYWYYLVPSPAQCGPHGHIYIVGDVGGTNSRLSLYKSDVNLQQEPLLASKTYPSQDYRSLTTVIKMFCEENEKILQKEGSPCACVMAVAGPVEFNKAYMPNTRWNMDGAQMEKDLKIPKVLLMNDFVAVGYGILGLETKDYHVVQDKPCNPRGPIVVYGPGTGLGQAYLTHDGKQYTVWPSEGGHSDWAPRSNQEMRLWHFLKARVRGRMFAAGTPLDVDHVSQERVISGSGIADVYDFYKNEYPEFVSEEIEKKMLTMNKSAVVSIHAQKKDNYVCRKAMEQWAVSFGQAVGDLALAYLPTGGIYIAGGVAPKNINLLREMNFTKWVTAKGRLSQTMESIPVFIVKQSVPVGLVGARVVARRVLGDIYPSDGISSDKAPKNRHESQMFLHMQYPEMEW